MSDNFWCGSSPRKSTPLGELEHPLRIIEAEMARANTFELLFTYSPLSSLLL